jgi:beta-galactosidase
MKFFAFPILIIWFSLPGYSQPATISLNGTWDFEQTETAFPPKKYSHKIPVPGLITLADPRIEQYDELFPNYTELEADWFWGRELNPQGDAQKLVKNYEPRYNWYRIRFDIPAEYSEQEATLTILKSKYVTQAYLNGIDLGTSISCYTPIHLKASHAMRYGKENELIVKVGDRAWLPVSAAGSTDKEKINYIPGIWDDVFISFSGKFKIVGSLVLPNVADENVDVKLRIKSYYPPQAADGRKTKDESKINIQIREKASGKIVEEIKDVSATIMRANLSEAVINIPVKNHTLWSPENPFLYQADIEIYDGDFKSDEITVNFGMRTFERRGTDFYLNNKLVKMRGTNITLHRFFEDPECANLPWDSVWVRKLLEHYPQQLNWNGLRASVGIFPKFWYDIADETGMMIQNEWLYWQTHGWDEQIKAEFTDWLWADGNHPSIIIWDAVNENWNNYIGDQLIPELKKLDPTRLWDAGYTRNESAVDDMDEPHPYRVGLRSETHQEWIDRVDAMNYRLGDLHDWPEWHRKEVSGATASLVNEYGWIWLWRNGDATKLTKYHFPYYLGDSDTREERRNLQSYWMQCQTEWLRADRRIAGVFAFTYLTNNYGHTGDWFIGEVKNLTPSPTLNWMQHSFAPEAVFIDLVDGRYMHQIKPYHTGERLNFNLVGINDNHADSRGNVKIELYNHMGEIVYSDVHNISIPKLYKAYIPVNIVLPEGPGGYVLIAKYKSETMAKEAISRRYIRVGDTERYEYYSYQVEELIEAY